ncbi:MAG: hypothetical protein OES12_10405, partial [Anaerolineae bacterium]|nr:hypothetical protein [Anaerolineae bacterium]
FHFLTIEDSGGMINIIIRPRIYEQYRQVIRQNPLLLVSGKVQHSGGVTDVLAERVEPLA